VALAAEIALRGLVHGRAARFGLVIAGGLVSYGAVLLMLGLGAEEKEILKRLAARAGRRLRGGAPSP